MFRLVCSVFVLPSDVLTFVLNTWLHTHHSDDLVRQERSHRPIHLPWGNSLAIFPKKLFGHFQEHERSVRLALQGSPALANVALDRLGTSRLCSLCCARVTEMMILVMMMMMMLMLMGGGDGSGDDDDEENEDQELYHGGTDDEDDIWMMAVML